MHTTTASQHRESRLFARSASDDKAPVIATLAAIDALRAARLQPAANLRFFFEGQEEVGSLRRARRGCR